MERKREGKWKKEWEIVANSFLMDFFFQRSGSNDSWHDSLTNERETFFQRVINGNETETVTVRERRRRRRNRQRERKKKKWNSNREGVSFFSLYFFSLSLSISYLSLFFFFLTLPSPPLSLSFKSLWKKFTQKRYRRKKYTQGIAPKTYISIDFFQILRFNSQFGIKYPFNGHIIVVTGCTFNLIFILILIPLSLLLNSYIFHFGSDEGIFLEARERWGNIFGSNQGASELIDMKKEVGIN